MRLPVTRPYRLTTKFGNVPGYPLNNGFHKGVDLVTADRKILMPESGVVTLRRNNGDDGNAVYIYFANRTHALCHLASFSVPDGSYQFAGAVIGTMGETGAADGVHLHWAVRDGAGLVDPMTLIDEEEHVELFNEGDRVNINKALYGHDTTQHQEQVGKPFKEAMYNILASAFYREFQDRQKASASAATTLPKGIYRVA